MGKLTNNEKAYFISLVRADAEKYEEVDKELLDSYIKKIRSC